MLHKYYLYHIITILMVCMKSFSAPIDILHDANNFIEKSAKIKEDIIPDLNNPQIKAATKITNRPVGFRCKKADFSEQRT